VIDEMSRGGSGGRKSRRREQEKEEETLAMTCSSTESVAI